MPHDLAAAPPPPRSSLQADAPRLYRLDITRSLRSQLDGKLVIEFPTLLVLLPGGEAGYHILSDEELAAEQQQGGARRQCA